MTKPSLIPAALAVAAISMIVGGAVQAASPNTNGEGRLRNDPRRPVAAIAADLDIAPEQFVACFSNVRPAPQGVRATGTREHANKAVLLPCLQKANSSITNDRLDAVMDKYRPEGRVAGR